MFFPTCDFPEVKILEDNYAVIKEELDRLHDRAFVPWPARGLHDNGWRTFIFYYASTKADHNCKVCPETTRILESLPHLSGAVFSRLAAGSHIKPHVGRPKPLYRCQLGLQIPAGDVAIRSVDAVSSWQEGKCLVFDDNLVHEAWNHTDQDRIVLIVDIPQYANQPQFKYQGEV